MAIADIADEDSDVSRTLKVLGGTKSVGGPVRSRLDAHEIIQRGFRAGVLDHLRRQLVSPGASRDLEKALGISLRTLQRHRKTPNKRLSPEQSGRAWKFAEILGKATRLFGSQEEAEAWLERPATALNQQRPIDLLSTPAGVESLEQLLGRLEYGVYT
jgi:putative toxin-antitoxin system antitoxin component (TIGR02293 family)